MYIVHNIKSVFVSNELGPLMAPRIEEETLPVDFASRSFFFKIIGVLPAEDEPRFVVDLVERTPGAFDSWLIATSAAVQKIDNEQLAVLKQTPGWSFPNPKPAKRHPALHNEIQNLSALKKQASSAVDDKTDTLISAGYTYGGVTLSTSSSAQLKWAGLYSARFSMAYPKIVPSMDNATFLTLNDASDVEAVFLGMVSFIALTVDAGTSLKQQIEAAADFTALTAVVDNRT